MRKSPLPTALLAALLAACAAPASGRPLQQDPPPPSADLHLPALLAGIDRPNWLVPNPPTPVPTSTPSATPSEAPKPTDWPEPPAVDPAITALMAQVSQERLSKDLAALVGFHTRHVLSSQTDPRRGVGAARRWLAARFAEAAAGGTRMTVAAQPFALDFGGRRTEQENVVDRLAGRDEEAGEVIVVAHYDSRNADRADGAGWAPGADDNGSGTVALLELARVLAAQDWPAGLSLAAVSAEEVGLVGSRALAARAVERRTELIAVINDDIIGGSLDAQGRRDAERFRLYSQDPDDGPSRALARSMAWTARRYGPHTGLTPVLVPQRDRQGRSSDHVPFGEAGFPAARLISAVEDTGRQHNTLDTLDRVDPAYHAAMTRLNLALVANLAQAPAPPRRRARAAHAGRRRRPAPAAPAPPCRRPLPRAP